MPTDHRSFWETRARFLALRHNFARWLSYFLPAATVACGATAVAVLVMRGLQAPLGVVWIVLSSALCMAAAAAGWLARRKMIAVPQALVRLEDSGRLHNRLSAAREGIGAWPAPAGVRDATAWNWQRLAVPLLVSALMLAGARWVPLPANAAAPLPREQPIAWSQVQSWLDLLEESKVVEPEEVEKIEALLEELRAQLPEKWYSQSSLEAGDSLREQTQGALRSLQRELQEAAEIAANAERNGAGLGKDELKKLDEDWQKALGGLQAGDLPLNKELLKKLKDFKPGSAKQMSAAQFAELRENLKECTSVCEKCVGVAKLTVTADETASGGMGGGGVSVPLSLKPHANDLRARRVENLENDDLSRALPGETLGVTTGEHEVKKATATATAGGAIASPGTGGAAVWREAMVPREREVLQRFFK